MFAVEYTYFLGSPDRLEYGGVSISLSLTELTDEDAWLNLKLGGKVTKASVTSEGLLKVVPQGTFYLSMGTEVAKNLSSYNDGDYFDWSLLDHSVAPYIAGSPPDFFGPAWSKVTLAESKLSKMTTTARTASRFYKKSTRNFATLEYIDSKGITKYKTFISSASGPRGHTERQILRFIKKNKIKHENVISIHSEKMPCNTCIFELITKE